LSLTRAIEVLSELVVDASSQCLVENPQRGEVAIGKVVSRTRNAKVEGATLTSDDWGRTSVGRPVEFRMLSCEQGSLASEVVHVEVEGNPCDEGLLVRLADRRGGQNARGRDEHCEDSAHVNTPIAVICDGE
jgi:hypothetical protein